MRDHAIHNEEACNLLWADGRFDDWVVTTAFYAALKLVNHQLFPFISGTNTYQEFIYYYDSLPRRGRKCKHQETISLVKHNIPEILSHYRRLHDSSTTARYNNYRLSSRGKAQIAREDLAKIKSACTKP
jgi:hypothetical protein